MSILLNKTEESQTLFYDRVQEVRSLGVPHHIAITMDGNRRWAKQRGLSAVHGHWKGAEIITEIVRFSSNLGVKVLTLYSFSTENWTRSKEEVDELMKLISFYLQENTPFMLKESVQLVTIGDLSRLPRFVQEILETTKKLTAGGNKIKLVLALNYGGRDEIKRAFLRIADGLEQGIIQKKDISEDLISKYLDTADLGDPDLFIRTSGEQRLSNFLLWQLSYTEVYIAKMLWPDFTKEDLLDAVSEFQKRSRRLGGT
ncbi:MAG: di-trans,poly-cis-decaprenylcistransferase [Verrucomicrobia bacterium]|nr:di-trans,poly-cis-decaprenylcistransferase [Verrucomicrobiota bacterium]